MVLGGVKLMPPVCLVYPEGHDPCKTLDHCGEDEGVRLQPIVQGRVEEELKSRD